MESTRELNQYALNLTNKDNPNVLFVGTASNDDEGYINAFTSVYEQLGCHVRSLCLVTKTPTDREIDELLSWADVIYVGGGDTISMMNIWKEHGLVEKLRDIYARDTAVLTGISAGAICWFECGHSDSESFAREGNWSFCWANGMIGFYPEAFCPHYNEPGRESFDEMLKARDLDGLAMENNTAFIEENGSFYFMRSNHTARAYRLIREDEILRKHEVEFRG